MGKLRIILIVVTLLLIAGRIVFPPQRSLAYSFGHTSQMVPDHAELKQEIVVVLLVASALFALSFVGSLRPRSLPT